MDTVHMDLADIGGNVVDGVHIAAMGGTWLSLVYGFAGMRDAGGKLSFRPHLPDQWEKLRFPLTVREQTFVVDIDRTGTTYTLTEGKGLILRHEDEEFRLQSDKPMRFESTKR